MLGRQLGGFLIPILKTVLPILNGILMVINELISMVLSLFGIDVKSLSKEFGIASGGLNDLEEGLNAVDKASKNAKKGLRGFDKLNNITTSTSSGSGSTGGVGVGGIDSSLLNALDEYNLKLEEMKNKATEIRDKIMGWLGFSKNANDEWEFTKLTWIDIVGLLGIALGIFNKITGGAVVKAFKDIAEYIGVWLIDGATFGEVLGAIGTTLGNLAILFAGISAIIGGIILTIVGIKDIINGDTFNGIMEALEGISLLVAGIALLFGGWEIAIIAGLVALTAVFTQWIVNNWKEIKRFFKNIWDNLDGTIFQPIKDFCTTAFNVVKPWVDAIGYVISYALKKVGEIVTGVVKAVASILTKIWEIFKKIIEIFVEIGKAVYTYIIEPLYNKYLKPIVTNIYNNVIKPLLVKFEWLSDKLASIFKTIWTFAIDFGAGLLKKVINGVFSSIEGMINTFIIGLNSVIKLVNKIPGADIKKVSLLSIPKLADGGFVDEGQMFIAREKGAEMVGSINNRTAVANNDQIVEAISIGVAKAMMSTQKDTTVNIVAQGDTSGLLDFIEFKQRQKNRQYGL